jgi:hypothetical protein
MTTKPSIVINKAEDEESQPLNASALDIPKRELYPEVGGRFKAIVMWLGLAFVVMVVLIQQFSGYS